MPPAVAQRLRASGRNKIIAGIVVFAVGILTLLLALPILWWGGMLFGGLLIYNGYRDMRRAEALGVLPGGPGAGPRANPLGVRTVRCPRCGTENAAGSRFCGRCGQTLGP